MKIIAEIIGNEATEVLKERYGVLVDRIFVEKKEGAQIFKMKFQLFNWKKTSASPTNKETERVLDIGVAEIEYTLYSFLNFGSRSGKCEIHLNNNLPKNGIHMHPVIYAELTGSERESMRRIEERLERK
jgi:hypothetical protein